MHKARRPAESIVLLSIGSAGELMELLLLLLRLLFIYFALRVKSTTYIMSWPKLKLHFRQVHTRASTETGLPSSIEKWHITYVIWAVRYRECVQEGGVINFTPAERHNSRPSRIASYCISYFAFLTAAKCILHSSVAIAQAWMQASSCTSTSTCHALLSSCHRVMWN